MEGFNSSIDNFKEKLFANENNLEIIKGNERETINSVVIPFLRILGYYTGISGNLRAEVDADYGDRKNKKVDLVLFKGQKPFIAIECKQYQANLDNQEFLAQLSGYFSSLNDNECQLGILTDGISYRFFSDLDKDNKMDKEAFFIFNLEDYTSEDLKILELFSYSKIDIKKIKEWARENKNYHKILRRLKEEIKHPSDELVKIFVNEIKDKKTKKDDKKKCSEYITKAFQEIFNLKAYSGEFIDQKPHETSKSNESLILSQKRKVMDFWRQVITDILSMSSEPLDAKQIWDKIQEKYPKEEIVTTTSKPVKRVFEVARYEMKNVQSIGKNPFKFSLSWTEQEILERYNDDIVKMYQEIKTDIMKIGNISINPTKTYISFKTNDKNFVGFIFQQSKIRVFFTPRVSEFSDPDKKLIDTYGKNTGNGSTEFYYENSQEKDYLLSLIKQSYSKCKG